MEASIRKCDLTCAHQKVAVAGSLVKKKKKKKHIHLYSGDVTEAGFVTLLTLGKLYLIAVCHIVQQLTMQFE